ncbi:hypothetical protein WALSEDRAFT_61218 [Wallemia mellicola CBS 633.66]|uniref:Uncharacterized protein n=1 Tax=Wallemia mellicola (strain ATCC MYA-4683 / CBS 633.66) TaxID=671144 RepID=I4Y7W3_WALMC|nr:hypothetical protein WALSEDRAFT_61218 [Wallemia mellicola CBS 633.66]EIM20055.1 hypothetical protein WALSEDRAFT_61218 [Wallemia mellicola CBS 633.66]|eukprot:XP_006959984.1 hypothetical protein WALSEDRAFT_61218 [Wallemia mellicola CBS 633.66]
MGQSKFKPRQTMSRINKPAPIKHSGDNNLPPVDHRRSGLSRPTTKNVLLRNQLAPKKTLAIHKTLKTHVENIKAIYEASVEVDDPEILKCFNFSKETTKILLLFGDGRLDALMERLAHGDNLNHDNNTTNADEEDYITDDDECYSDDAD